MPKKNESPLFIFILGVKSDEENIRIARGFWVQKHIYIVSVFVHSTLFLGIYVEHLLIMPKRKEKGKQTQIHST